MAVNLANKPVFSAMSRVLVYQLLIILTVGLLYWMGRGWHNALSMFAGAMCYWLPTALFIWRLSAYASPHAGVRFLAAFLLGEGLKLLLCGVLFVIFIKYFHIQVMDAVIGLAVAITAFWVASAALIFRTGVK
jgi:F0F1-type ATP synthase assembly protein I